MNEILNDWFCLFVKSGEEENIKKKLENIYGSDKLRFVVPKRKIKQRRKGKWFFTTKPLFPGYILVNGNVTLSQYRDIPATPEVYKWLKCEDGLLPVEKYEVDIINKLTINGDIAGISDVYFEGNEIKVISGVLVGLDGLIVKVNRRKGRVKIKTTFLGDKRVLELGINEIKNV